MKILKCQKYCCVIKVKPYIPQKKYYINKNKKKAGVFFIDNKTNKILLVQSRGNLWGPPKGSLNIKESVKECALREVFEETGIVIKKEDLNEYTIVKGNSTYFLMEIDENEVFIQKNMNENINDANGITWININCLNKEILLRNMNITCHCKILLNKYFSI
tara:strand:- start:200 stop:682 length:483 start_codon:yes stop_codon:yes gene_type:complete